MKKVEEIKLKCSNCNKDFYRKRYRIKKVENHFCSHACQTRYFTNKRNREKRITCTCTNCKKSFEITKSSYKRRKNILGIFCTKKCYYDYRKENSVAEYVSLKCHVCGKIFSRLARTEKQLRKTSSLVCCSRGCSTRALKENPDYIKYRLFHQISNEIRKGTIEVGEDVDEDYILEIWKNQDGKCPYSGEKLVVKPTRKRGERIPYQASIDRIDSSKGYIRGNIEIVSLIANMAKNMWSKNDVIDFAKKVTKHAKRRSSL